MEKEIEYFIPDRHLEPNRLTTYCHLIDYLRPAEVWHRHDFDELVIVRSGKGHHVTETGSYPISRGDAFLIPRGKCHGYEKLENLKIANLLFHKEVLKEKCGDLTESPGFNLFFENSTKFKEEFRFSNRLTLSERKLLQCEQIFAEMQQEQSGDHPGRCFINELLFLNLCVLICRSFSSEGESYSTEISDLSRLLQFMEENHARPLKLNDLARAINRSVSSLMQLFHSAMEKSPIEYLNTIRMEQAAKELRETDHTVSAVAFAHGFSDSNYFSTRFSRHFGCSPRQYRFRHRNTPQEG